MVQVDPLLLEQAMFNLLDNAGKYAPEGTTIRLRGWASGKWMDLQIIDEGPGIPPEDVERIFDKFYRVRKGDQVRAGTGLGLAIARSLAERAGGRLELLEGGGPGARFRLTLPLLASP